jgi:hypothetical protein
MQLILLTDHYIAAVRVGGKKSTSLDFPFKIQIPEWRSLLIEAMRILRIVRRRGQR